MGRSLDSETDRYDIVSILLQDTFKYPYNVMSLPIRIKIIYSKVLIL